MIAAVSADVVSRRIEEAVGVVRATACRALATAELVALAGAPAWTPAALAAVDLGPVVAHVFAPLVRRSGRGDDQLVELEVEALPAIRAELERRGDDVVALARELGERVASADLELPRVLAAWTELARGLSAGPSEVAERLITSVRDACERGRPGQALDRLEAAAALERVIGGPLAVAVRIGRHRVELAQRTARDRRALVSFVPRPEAMAALDRLLADDGPAAPWALHYLGVGGVGKTTLLRHLSVEVARERGLAVARVDFDYLSPSYPATDPGLLIECIVSELTLRIEAARQDRWLRSIEEHLGEVRRVAAEAPTDDPLAPFRWDAFDRLLSFVGSFLSSLGRPVIVLDTCEELMKLAPVGGKVPSVEATFALCEALHERCPALRVVFAGRRLLAERGQGWQAPPASVPRALTAGRDYLALHELRGFRRGEAEAALARLLPAERRDDRALLDAVLTASPEDERATEVERPAAVADDESRYSPFRVAAFGAWVASEPKLPVARLTASAVDPYIEHRIVRRMGGLEPLLPVVALLRRFDRATLAAVIGEGDGPAAFDALAGHEWLDVDHEPMRGTVLTAKRSVVLPLERYLVLDRPEAWGRARVAVAAALAPRLADSDALSLPPELVDAALRALPANDAVAAWTALEARVGGGWTAALALAKFLLGEGAAGEDAGTLLGAAIRATMASALVHTQPAVDLSGLWDEVATTAQAATTGALASADPPPSAGAVSAPWLLLLRARLGGVAARAWAGAGELDDQLDEVTRVLTELVRWRRLPLLACPFLAALEAVVERAEREGERAPTTLARAIEGCLSEVEAGSFGAAMFLATLFARLHHLDGGDAAARALGWRLAQVRFAPALPTTVLDWLPPASMASRLQLELVRFGFLDLGQVSERPEALLVPPAAADADLDSEHLRAALGLHAEARSRGPVGALPQGLSPPRRYRAYVRFPSGGFQIALCRDGRLPVDGDVGRAPIFDHLDRVERAAFAMDRAVLAPIRGGEAAVFRLDHARADAVTTGASVPLSVLASDGVDVVDGWALQAATTQHDVEALVDAVRPHLDRIGVVAAGGPLGPRLRAVALLEQAIELSRYTGRPLTTVLPALPEVAAVHPDDAEDVARGALVAVAAGTLTYPPRPSPPPGRATLAHWLADYARAVPRRFAQLAHDEGQLLALRLPARGLRLLTLAAEAYAACGDAIGAAAARLAADVARRRQGQPMVSDGAALVAALPADEAAVLAPLVRRLASVGDSSADRLLAPVERGAPRRPALSARVAAWWRRRSTEILGVTIGLAVLALMGALGFGALRWLQPKVSGWLGARLELGTVARLVFGIGALGWGGYKVAGWAWRLYRDWREDRRLRALALAGQVRRVGARDVVISLATDDELTVTLTSTVPRAGRLPALAEVVGGDTSSVLRPLIHRLAEVGGRGAAPLALAVEAGIAVHAWEAAVLAAHPSLREGYAPWRPVSVTRAPAAEAVEGGLRASVALRASLGRGLAGPGVIHAIGRPVRTGDRIALDLGDEVAGAAPLVPADLAPTGAQLVILQGAPQAASESPTDAVRSEVCLLRELALALVGRGVAEVIVVPPVPEATLRGLARVEDDAPRLGRPFRRRRDRLALSHAIRHHLWGLGDDAHEAAALEVTHLIATVRDSR